MLIDKKGLFKEFDVVVNGKFVAMLIAPYARFRKEVNEFEFYFGVYNHKYFSMCPRFSLDCYMSCGSSEDFRLATDVRRRSSLRSAVHSVMIGTSRTIISIIIMACLVFLRQRSSFLT